MLQSIRDSTQGWLTNTVIGLLIIVFALWGIHGFLELHNENGAKVIAKAAGQALSQRDFDTAYQRLYRQAQMRFGIASLDQKVVEQLKKQTIEQWSLLQVLWHSALQENYRLSQPAVDSALLSMPVFQSSGHFSSTRFYNVLDAMGYTELNFLSDLKKTLLISQVRQGLTQTAFSLPEELNKIIRLTHQKRDFAYVVIPSTSFSAKPLLVSNEQALAYYQNNKEGFVQPEQVSVEYIKLSLANGKNDKTFVENRDKLANLSYMHPDSLDKAAKALNLPIQSSGFFSRAGGKNLLANPKIIDAAFTQDILQGNNSPVIDLNADTSIVLRIKQHKMAMIQPFSEVKEQILGVLQKKLATEKTQLIGEKLLAQLKANGSFSDSKKINNLNWQIINHTQHDSDKVQPVILNAVFNLSLSKKTGSTSVTGFSLPNGDYVLIKLIAVHDGTSENLATQQKAVYRKALAKDFGQMDYDLYVHSLT
ncbi:MAG: SurA N-terminal domain-containing protein [Pseudomonadota bacterium]